MRLSRWFVLIGALLALGSVKVAQTTAIWLKAYELGQQRARLHELENETLWLKAQVLSLESPAHLAKIMKDDDLNLVAWAELPEAGPFASTRSKSP